jgi:dynein heavy chain
MLLLQAIPILNDALAALDTIKEADIAYIKKLQNPPSAIKLVLEAVCVVLDVKPVKVRGGGVVCLGACNMYQLRCA